MYIPRKQIEKSVLISLIISVAIGLFIGFIKYLFEDIAGFSLIIIFPLAYGWIIGFVLAKLFSNYKLQSRKLAIIFASISITVAIVLFLNLDRVYLEGLILAQLTTEGEDITDMYLPWDGYFRVIGELGTSVGFGGIRGVEIKGVMFYGLMLIEFGLMYYFALRNVSQQYRKLTV